MTYKYEDDALGALFAQAKGDMPGPDLMARVMADAAAVQAQATTMHAVSAPPLVSWLGGLLGALGGWSAVSGITAAGVMGLAVGLYSPEAVAGLLDNDSLSLGIGMYDVTPNVGDLWTEDGDV